MTSTVTYAEYEAARQAIAMLAGKPTYERSVDHDACVAVLKSARSGSSGVVAIISDYGPILPHVGSSSFIFDCRSAKRLPMLAAPQTSTDFNVLALSVVEQMQELLASLSLNKSQLAKILRVTRPTMYDWLQGKDPNPANTERLHVLLRTLARASVSGAAPLNARFVRQPMALDTPSLIDLLGEERIDEDRVIRAIEQARALGEAASRRRTNREERLRVLGFEEPTREQLREQLARNVALKDWPE